MKNVYTIVTFVLILLEIGLDLRVAATHLHTELFNEKNEELTYADDGASTMNHYDILHWVERQLSIQNDELGLKVERILRDQNAGLEARVKALEQELLDKSEMEKFMQSHHFTSKKISGDIGDSMEVDYSLQIPVEKGLKGNVSFDDSTGYDVLKPKMSIRSASSEHIAFSAYLHHDMYHVAPGRVIKCDVATLNDGYAYNAFTGVFTVPLSGTYIFHYVIESFLNRLDVNLVVNGVAAVSAITDPRSSQNVMGGNTVILRATQGQTVWLEAVYDIQASVASDYSFRRTTFSGHLLY